MTGGREGVGSTVPEVLVDLLLGIRRYAHAMCPSSEHPGWFVLHPGTDPAGSITDLDGVPDPRGSPVVAVDGGGRRFTARETEEGILVVGDLRGIASSARETEVDLGEDALILTLGGRIVSRVPIDDGWTSITDVSVNNEVLEVRVRIGE